MGSAYKNKGVQLLMDAVTQYLPCPADISNEALDTANEERPVKLTSNSEDLPSPWLLNLKTVLMAKLTYIRVYQGDISKGDTLINARSGRKVKIGRVARMHADQMEDIETIPAGYIGALFGIECCSGIPLYLPACI